MTQSKRGVRQAHIHARLLGLLAMAPIKPDSTVGSCFFLGRLGCLALSGGFHLSRSRWNNLSSGNVLGVLLCTPFRQPEPPSKLTVSVGFTFHPRRKPPHLIENQEPKGTPQAPLVYSVWEKGVSSDRRCESLSLFRLLCLVGPSLGSSPDVRVQRP